MLNIPFGNCFILNVCFGDVCFGKSVKIILELLMKYDNVRMNQNVNGLKKKSDKEGSE